jgi:hypothetical protein
LLAGLIGSLTGLGGGIIITPLLTLVVGVDIHYAIGAALVSVIATSCGAASAYVKEGLSNIRLGMFMEVATTTGALIRASLALRVSTAAIAELFGAVLFIRAGLRFGRARSAATEGPDAAAMSLELDSGYPTASGFASYHVHHILGGDRRDARRWNAIWSPGDRIWRFQSNRLRQGYEGRVQSLDDDEQLHDRGGRRGKRRLVLQRGSIDPGRLCWVYFVVRS